MERRMKKVFTSLGLTLAPSLCLWAGETASQVANLSTGGGLYDMGALLGAGISVGLGCIGAGVALSSIGSSVVGAISEKPELMGRLLIILGLGEALAIYGLVMGILLWIKA